MRQQIQKQNNLYTRTGDIARFIEYFHKKICIMICCLIGLPGQTKKDLTELGKLLREFKNMGCVIAIYNAELHPGSGLFTLPDRFGIELKLKNFMDYYNFLMEKNDKNMIYGYVANKDIYLEEQRELLENVIYGTG